MAPGAHSLSSKLLPQAFLLWSHQLWGDINPESCPFSIPQPVPMLPDALFIVSVPCLLVLSAATLRQRPAKPANSLGRTKCRALSNSLPLSTPLSPALMRSLIFPFQREGAEIVLKTATVYGTGELWRHHKPPGVLVLGRFPNLPSLSCGSVSSFTLVTWKGVTDPELILAPLPSSSWFLHSFLPELLSDICGWIFSQGNVSRIIKLDKACCLPLSSALQNISEFMQILQKLNFPFCKGPINPQSCQV